MIVGIYEDRTGRTLVEVHKDEDGFRLKFPYDEDAVPFERLEQIKAALEDVIWQKGRSIPVPEKHS